MKLVTGYIEVKTTYLEINCHEACQEIDADKDLSSRACVSVRSRLEECV